MRQVFMELAEMGWMEELAMAASSEESEDGQDVLWMSKLHYLRPPTNIRAANESE